MSLVPPREIPSPGPQHFSGRQPHLLSKQPPEQKLSILSPRGGKPPISLKNMLHPLDISTRREGGNGLDEDKGHLERTTDRDKLRVRTEKEQN